MRGCILILNVMLGLCTFSIDIYWNQVPISETEGSLTLDTPPASAMRKVEDVEDENIPT